MPVGTWQLVRLALRRDRFSLPAWVVVLGVLPATSATTYEQLYPTAAARAPLTALMSGNPAIAVVYGPAFDLSTPGGFTAWRTLSFLGVFVALMAIFTVTRHTRDNPQMREIFQRIGGSGVPIDAFLAQIAALFAMVAALYGVQAALRMRSEEDVVRLEPLLATRLTRLRWAGGHLLFALAGSAVVLAAGGLALGLAHGLRVGDIGGYVPTMLGSTLSQLPAVWVVVGVAAVLFGLLPRYTAAAWAFAATFVMLTLFGPVIDLPQLVLDASPFRHTPRVPGNDVVAGPLLWLVAVAVAGLAAGLAGSRRRDIG